MNIALVAGASGLVGTALVKQLIENEEYDAIHILVRRSLDFKSDKVIEHIIDFDNIEKLDVSIKIDHVFCSLGTTIKKAKSKENFRKVDYDYVLDLAKITKELNAKKFLVVSSLGANSKSVIFYSRIKGEIEKALQQLKLQHLFIFRPSLLLGNRKEHRAGEKTAIKVYSFLAPVFIGPFKKYKGIGAEKVANAMIRTALNNNESYKIIESDEIQNF